jgi:hypothetical protein
MDDPQLQGAARRATRFLVLTIVVALSACSPASMPRATSSATPAPDNCGSPSLTIGTAVFAIRAFRPAANDFLGVPSASPKVAFWIAGTEANLAFVIAPDAENLSVGESLLSSIAGQSATVRWADCTSTTYTLSSAKEAASSGAALPDQSIPGITLFFQQDSSGSLSVVRGALAGQQVNALNTPMPSAVETPAFPTSSIPTPDAKSIQAEISLLDIKASADGRSVQVSISILNTGQPSFDLSTESVALTAEDATVAKLLESEPSLPQSFKPGEPKGITLTFARPSSPTATLKILDIEYDIEGY